MTNLPAMLQTVLVRTAENLERIDPKQRDNHAVKMRATIDAILVKVGRHKLHPFALSLKANGYDVDPAIVYASKNAPVYLARFVLELLETPAVIKYISDIRERASISM